MQDQRINQGIHDKIVLFVGGLDVVTAVIEMFGDARISVRLVRVIIDPDLADYGIDLHRIDVLHAVLQGMRQVVARAGADHHHILERRARGVLLEEMDDRIERAGLVERHHHLVADGIYQDFPAASLEVHRVVRRPLHLMVLEVPARRGNGKFIPYPKERGRECKSADNPKRPAPP